MRGGGGSLLDETCCQWAFLMMLKEYSVREGEAEALRPHIDLRYYGTERRVPHPIGKYYSWNMTAK